MIVDNWAINVNAVVNKSFYKKGKTIDGILTKIISNTGNHYIRS